MLRRTVQKPYVIKRKEEFINCQLKLFIKNPCIEKKNNSIHSHSLAKRRPQPPTAILVVKATAKVSNISNTSISQAKKIMTTTVQ